MTSDDLFHELLNMVKAHPESAAVTVGARTPTGAISNHVAIRYNKKHHHVIIEGFSLEKTKRPPRSRRRPARKKHV